MSEEQDFSNAPISLGEIKAQKDKDASKWGPRDVLIDLLRKIDNKEINPDTIIVMIHDLDEVNAHCTTWAISSQGTSDTLALLTRGYHRIIKAYIND